MKPLCWILIGFSLCVHAQRIDTVASKIKRDSSEKKIPDNYLGVFLSASERYGQFVDKIDAETEYGGGIVYNKWTLGVGYNVYRGRLEERIIFPNIFRLKYMYTGVFLEYSLLKKKWLKLNVGGGFYRGRMEWYKNESGEVFFRDHFHLSSLALNLSMERVGYIKPYVQLTYRRMGGLDLNNVENNDFSGFNASIGIRIGYFNQ